MKNIPYIHFHFHITNIVNILLNYVCERRWPMGWTGEADLGLGVDVVLLVLQQQRGWLDVVLLGGDVQGGQPHLALGVVLEQHAHHPLVALLQRHRQRREAILHDKPTQSRTNGNRNTLLH